MHGRARTFHPLRLLWSPLSLPEVAATASPRACLIGGAAMILSGWWFFSLLALDLYGPWGQWNGVVADIPPAILAGPLLGSVVLLPLSLLWLALWWRWSSRHAGVRSLLLSSLPFVMPFGVWITCAILIDLNNNVMADGSIAWLTDSTLFGIFASCFWPFALLLAWTLLAGAAWPRAQALAAEQGLCPACGYDLRGSVAAGSTACPECGAVIA